MSISKASMCDWHRHVLCAELVQRQNSSTSVQLCYNVIRDVKIVFSWRSIIVCLKLIFSRLLIIMTPQWPI